MTDSNGEATVSLTTSVATTVSASAAGKTTLQDAVVAALGLPRATLTCQGSGPQTAPGCDQVPGQPVTFAVTRGEGTTQLTSVVLDFGDGVSIALGALPSALTLVHTYKTPATYTATLHSTDVHGQTTSVGLPVRVQGSARVTLVCQGTEAGGTSCTQLTGQPVVFTASLVTGSPDLVGAILDFGDGTAQAMGTLFGATTAIHAYAAAANYTATLRATDVAGQNVSASVAVRVQGSPGVTLTCGPCAQEAGQAVIFSASRVVGSSSLTSATLDFGDGNSQSMGTLLNATTAIHTYSSAGNYAATLRATDVAGQTATAIAAIKITAKPPLALTFSAPVEGTRTAASAQWTFTATTDAGVESFSWDFGDGTKITTSAGTTSHIYTAIGSRVITVTAKNVDGRTATGRAEIIVRFGP